MTETLLIVAIALLVVVIVVQIALFFRRVQIDLSPVQQAFQSVEKAHERTERAVRDEIAKNREESSNAARQSREEIASTLKAVGDSLTKQLGAQAQANDQKLGAVRETVEKRLGALQEENTKKLDQIRQESTAASQKMREDVNKIVNDFINWQQRQFGLIVEQLKTLTESNEKRLDAVRTTLEQKLKTMQDENAKQLEEMRKTVDEKLHDTLEKRLGESFKQVSDRLADVYKGLGEMQALATGVGDLKKVLTNVKTRGTWGEVQLGMLLEEVLDQVKEKLQQASNKIDDVAVRSRAIGRKLKKVEELPSGDADKVLMLEGLDGELEGDGEAES